MTLTRRQFLGRTGITAGGILGASLLGNPLLRPAMAQSLGDRYFVSLFLDGGNDGLNTLTPIEDGASGSLRAHYEWARTTGSGGLRLSPQELVVPSGPPLVDPNTTTQLGLHPGLTGLADLYSRGHVAIIQGCGYPRPNLSHATSSDIWESADPLRTGLASGWLGRHLAQNFGSSEIPAVALRNSIPGEFQQTATSVLTASKIRNFTFPYDTRHTFDNDARREALMALALSALASGQSVEEQVGSANQATLLASESYPPLHASYEADRASFDDSYSALRSGTASDLREVAKVIYGVERGVPNVEARYFEVRNGGYDSHSDQGAGNPDGRHYRLHQEVGDALQTFFADCEDMGVADRICVMVWSEFSRRITQNDTGTDHGTQGPMFVIGGTVQGGLYGNHPNIEESALDNGNSVYSQDDSNPFRSMDFRDVYGAILKNWINVPEATIRASLLPQDSGDPLNYWTQPQFDQGFF